MLRDVRVGATVDGRAAILEGLAAGEQVVLEGIDRLREGSEVNLVGAPVAPADGTSTPAGS